MPALSAVLATIQAQVSAATAGLLSAAAATAGQSLVVQTGIGWPSIKSLQNNVRTLTALIGILDRGLATDSTRWKPVELMRSVVPATLTVTPNSAVVYQSAVILTLGGSVTAGDALGIGVASIPGLAVGGTVVVSVPTDTPTTIAAKAAAQINADPFLSTVITASASGAIITLTPITSGAVTVIANTGNGATRTREIGRRLRHFQITTWTNTDADRSTVSDPIEQMIADAESNFGFTFPDGTMGRVLYAGDTLHNDAVLSDTYSRSLMLSIDYPITTTDALYAVLVPVAAYTVL